MNASILTRLKHAAALVSLTVLAPLFATSAQAAPPASYTTTNISVDGAGHCFNGGKGGDPVNCNIYDAKKHVWLNGGPIAAALGPGDYFFAVMQPSGQGNPNDGSDDLLSFDPTPDPYGQRTFTVNEDLSVSYSGGHDKVLPKIRLGIAPNWYDTTPNNGGTYIISICRLVNGLQPDKKDCKFDAFKLVDVQPPPPPVCGDPGQPLCPCECGERDANGQCPKSCVTGPILNITKDATGAYTATTPWTITKAATPLVSYLTSGSATVNYTVTVSPSAPTISDVKVTGNIEVTNSGDSPATDAVVTDTLQSPFNLTCSITNPENFGFITSSAPASSAYTCSLLNTAPTLSPVGGTNQATVAWTALAGQSPASAVAFFGWDTVTQKDQCVTVSDTVQGSLDTELCASEDGTYTYTRSIPAVSGCVTYPNIASFVAADTGATKSANASVTVCAPVESTAHTMGYWQNKNGQAQIKGATCGGEGGIDTFLNQFAPLADLGCNGTLASNVTTIIKAANASGSSMNAMLKAQMLATALSAYFDTAVRNLDVDLTKICKNLSSCGVPPAGYEITSMAFGGLAVKHLTVMQLLAYASSQYVSANDWYGQVKATQGLAKDTFDAINNRKVFAWFPGP